MTPPPYFAQWETEALAWGAPGREDPLWAASGAANAAEYHRRADHLCGVACLRMALGAMGRPVPAAHALRRAVQARGGYVEEADGTIRGLIYAGAVEWLAAQGIAARIALDEAADGIPARLAAGGLFIASVHPLIRMPGAAPPYRGGHLVLVWGVDGAGRLRVHNPSGHTAATRRDARLGLPDFARFHAERGIWISP